MAYVSRNPFARTELHKQTVTSSHGCSWCGNSRKGGKLFEYRFESDGGSKGNIKGQFCSVGCMRSYHNVGSAD